MPLSDLIPENELQQKVIELKKSQNLQRLLLGLKYLSCALFVLSIIGLLTKDKNESIHSKFTVVFILAISTSLMSILQWRFPNIQQYIPYALSYMGMIVTTERNILLYPENFHYAEPLFFIQTGIEFFNIATTIDRRAKLFQTVTLWGYYAVRNYMHYQFFSVDFIACVSIMIMFCDLTSAQYEDYINSITELLISRNQMVIQSFISTLKVVPHGIVVLNQQDQEISYVNEETVKIFHESDSCKIKCRLRNFKHKSLTIQEESHDSFESISIEDIGCPQLIKIEDNQETNNRILFDSDKQTGKRDKINLLEYLLRKQRYQIHDQNDHLFKDVQNKQYLLVKCTPINARSQLLVCFNDISKLKYLEKTSKKIKSMFFSSIAHELRTPLNSIIPISKQLRQQFTNDQEVRFYLDIIINSSHHLENVIEDALDMSRIENNKFEINMTSFDLRQIIQEIKEIMEFQAKQKDLNLKVDINAMVPSHIITDKKRYRQVLFNLVGNALKFTYEGYVHINVTYQNGMLVTQVTDTGIGISSDDIKKLFVFFGKVDCQKSINQSGMGLGLTISKMIVEQLHGSISCSSILNHGSKFTFQLPIYLTESCSDTSNLQSQSLNRDHHSSQNRDSQISQRISNNQQISLHSHRFDQTSIESLFTREDSVFDCNIEDEDEKDQLSLKIGSQYLVDKGIKNMSNFINDQLVHPGKVFNVLLVDDSPYNLIVLKELLKKIEVKMDIQKAMNGQMALTVLRNYKNLINVNKCIFDFIFMDLHMPVLDGFQTLQKVREMEEQGIIDMTNTKVIGFSALTYRQFQENPNSELFDQFIEKPIELKRLRELFEDDKNML